MEESRKQFEMWIENEHGFHGIDIEWHQTRNCYAQFGIHLAWCAWKASRSAIELDLPPRKSAYASGYGDGYLVEHQDGEAIDYEDTVEILRAAGLRVKEK